jgi:hypothetical protein
MYSTAQSRTWKEQSSTTHKASTYLINQNDNRPVAQELTAQLIEDKARFEVTDGVFGAQKSVVFYAAEDANPRWVQLDTSGFLGLGSYDDMFRTYKKFNFLYQMKSSGIIDHMIYSIPRTLDHIYFGGWDEMENTNEFTLFKSDSRFWRIPVKTIDIGFTRFETSGTRYIHMDPAYPDIYVPKKDWDAVATRIKEIH